MVRSSRPFTWWRDIDYAAPHKGLAIFAQIEGTRGNDNLHGRRAPDTINGRGGDDVLNDRDGDDTLNGDGGNDVIKGSGGRYVLNGGTGDDRLYGGTERQDGSSAGRDRLDGGVGDDRLYGGYESDGLIGGAGKDRFTYTEFGDSSLEHSDTILDFVQGIDKLVFREEFRSGDGLHFIGDTAFSGTPGEVRFAADADSSIVEIDLDGNGITDLRIIFTDGIEFQASDFSF